MPLQYLSFQRPPPRQIKECEQITISPLITNDLRDEAYAAEEGEVEIRVAWVCIGNAKTHERLATYEAAEDAADAATTKVHIVKREQDIRWTGSECSWKNVKLTAPSRTQMSEAVLTEQNYPRLAMWVEAQRQEQRPLTDASRPRKRTKVRSDRVPRSSRSTLEELSVDPTEASRRSSAGGTVFVPVLTPPIEVRGADASTTTVEKMTRNCRLVRVPATEGADASYFEIMEENGYELDKHIWDASFPLMSLLSSGKAILPPATFTTPTSSTVQDIQEEFGDSETEVVILELGSGTGLLSLYIQRWLEAQVGAGKNNKIVASDLSDSLQFTRENVDLNVPQEEDEDGDVVPAEEAAAQEGNRLVTHDKTHKQGADFFTIPLDWYDEELPKDLRALLNEGCTSAPQTLLILASDCSYNPDTYEAFASLLRRLWDYRTGRVYCLISKKHRHEDEKALWKELQRHGLKHQLIDGHSYDDDDGEGAGEPGTWGIFGLTRDAEDST